MTGKSLKPTLVVVLLLTFMVSANAQWDVAIKGGISIPNLSAAGSQQNPLNTGYSSRLGPDFSLDHEYHFSKLFSLVGSVEYSSQGGKKNGYQAFTTPSQLAGYFEEQNMTPPPYLYATYNSEAKFGYLLVPILAKVGWDLGHHSPWRFYVAAGPFLGILLSAKQVTSGNSMAYLDAGKTEPLPIGSQSFDQKTDLMDQLHHVNFGIDGYIGFSYALNAARDQHLFIEGGGNYGFINIQKGTANGKNNTGAGVVTFGYSRAMHCMHKKKAS
jgi:hypothetical protein